MRIKYFKNGNINIKFDPDELHELQTMSVYRMSCLENEVLATLLDSVELDFIASDDVTGCASNWNMHYNLYNARTDKQYLPLDRDFLEAATGKTLKLYAQDISENDLKEQFSEYYGD